MLPLNKAAHLQNSSFWRLHAYHSSLTKKKKPPRRSTGRSESPAPNDSKESAIEMSYPFQRCVNNTALSSWLCSVPSYHMSPFFRQLCCDSFAAYPHHTNLTCLSLARPQLRLFVSLLQSFHFVPGPEDPNHTHGDSFAWTPFSSANRSVDARLAVLSKRNIGSSLPAAMIERRDLSAGRCFLLFRLLLSLLLQEHTESRIRELYGPVADYRGDP
jgi:hypothetical protein